MLKGLLGTFTYVLMSNYDVACDLTNKILDVFQGIMRLCESQLRESS